MHKEGHTPMNNDTLSAQSSSSSNGQDHHWLTQTLAMMLMEHVHACKSCG